MLILKLIKSTYQLSKFFKINFLYDVLFLEFFKSNIKYSSFDKNKKSILVLNSFRFTQDLDIIQKSPEFNILFLNSKWHHRFISIFFGKNLQEANHFYQAIENKNFECIVNIEGSLDRLVHKYNIHSFLSCSFTYKQDFPIATYCVKNKNVKFNLLYKEFLKDEIILNETINRYKSSQCKFIGHTIFLANKTIEKILIEAGVILPHQSKIIGSIRFDGIYSKKRSSQQETKVITLFSFMHASGLLQLENKHHFTKNTEEGFYNLFHNVHKTMGYLSSKYPKIRIVIKCKYGGNWFEAIDDVFLREFKKSVKEFKNIDLDCLTSSHDLIEQSSAIVCFNSTTVLEAICFGKIPIIPVFDEALTKYFNTNVFFKKYFNLLNICNSADELLEMIQEEIANPSQKIELEDYRSFFKEYIFKYDGLATRRFIKELCNEKN